MLIDFFFLFFFSNSKIINFSTEKMRTRAKWMEREKKKRQRELIGRVILIVHNCRLNFIYFKIIMFCMHMSASSSVCECVLWIMSMVTVRNGGEQKKKTKKKKGKVKNRKGKKERNTICAHSFGKCFRSRQYTIDICPCAGAMKRVEIESRKGDY